MLKKWHKVVLLVFLVVSAVYFLSSAIKTTYWMIINPQNRQAPFVYVLPLQVIILSALPILVHLSILKRCKKSSITFGVVCSVLITALVFIPGSYYSYYSKDFFSAIMGKNPYLSTADTIFLGFDTFCIPLMLVFVLFSLYLAIFKLKKPNATVQ